MVLGPAVLGGQLVLGPHVRGTASPRITCPGGPILRGDILSCDTGTAQAGQRASAHGCFNHDVYTRRNLVTSQI